MADQFLPIFLRVSEKMFNYSEYEVGRAFQWAIDEVRTLPLTPSKGGSKSEFIVF